MVNDPFLVGFFYGLVPAMGFLYILLHNYEGLFNERRAFFAFLLGAAGGLIATLLLLTVLPSAQNPRTAAVVIPLYGLMEAMVFAAFLNTKRFRDKPDTAFYGVGFGLGFGALYSLFLVGYGVVALNRTGAVGLVEVALLSLVGIFFISITLFHAAAGAWIGRGVTRRRIAPAILQAAVLEAAGFGLFYLMLFPSALSNFVPFATLGIGLVLVRHVLRDVLDPILPPEVRREMEIHKRRLARRIAREPTPTETRPDEAHTGGSPEEDAPGPAPPSP